LPELKRLWRLPILEEASMKVSLKNTRKLKNIITDVCAKQQITLNMVGDYKTAWHMFYLSPEYRIYLMLEEKTIEDVMRSIFPNLPKRK
jgi:hypothetical protein